MRESNGPTKGPGSGGEETGTMKSCEKTLALLSDFLLGETDPAASATVKDHLEQCAVCRGESGRLDRLLGTLGDVEVPDPGEVYWRAFLPRLRRRIAQTERAPTVSPFRVASALAASLVICLAAATLLGRWEAPNDWNPLARLDRLARHQSPEQLQQAVDEVVVGTVYGLSDGEETDTPATLRGMQQALESLLPADESDIYLRAEELSPEARGWLVWSLGSNRG